MNIPNPNKDETLVDYINRLMKLGEYTFLEIKLNYIKYNSSATT